MEKLNIHTTKTHLVIEVPLITNRSNPWDETFNEEMPAIVGLIKEDESCGFSYRIDMDYKDKGDQWTDHFYEYPGLAKEFIKLCKKLKIDYVSEIYIKKTG